MELAGKSTLVTGASRGIGREIARAYCAHGGRVIACARSGEHLESLEKECRSESGELATVIADVTDEHDQNKVVETAIERYGLIDVLVNNAGILGPRERIAEYPDDIWDQVIEVNLNAVFHLTKLVLKHMLDRNRGRIINVTSGVGVRGSSRWGAYAVSKFGVEGLTQVLADELRETSVGVNAVNPGPIATDMRAKAYPDEDPETIPAPADIMDVFLHLAAQQNGEANGERYEAQEFQL